MPRKPVVAIVGRPNVGKSTLFNRLIGGRRAIVEDIPGTTRDRLYGETEWRDRAFTVIDTGGLETRGGEGYTALIREQVREAMAEADAILFMVDTAAGVTAADAEIAALLRRSDKTVLLVANKTDNAAREEHVVEFHELGFGDPIPISAYHGLGIRELQERLLNLTPESRTESAEDALRVAIVGQPHAGKAAFGNAVLRPHRVIVSAEAGTTRDAVDTLFQYQDRAMVLVDTAGMR